MVAGIEGEGALSTGFVVTGFTGCGDGESCLAGLKSGTEKDGLVVFGFLSGALEAGFISAGDA
jgi:hypothetical protein